MEFSCAGWGSWVGLLLVAGRREFVLAVRRTRTWAAGTAAGRTPVARLAVSTLLSLVVAGAAAAQQTEARERARPSQGISVERVVAAELVFDPEVVDWAALYRDPPRELVPVGFGRVSFERRSMLRTVSAAVLVAVSAYGVGKAIEGRANGAGWGRTGLLLAPSALGVVSGGLGIARWSQVRQVRRVGW